MSSLSSMSSHNEQEISTNSFTSNNCWDNFTSAGVKSKGWSHLSFPHFLKKNTSSKAAARESGLSAPDWQRGSCLHMWEGAFPNPSLPLLISMCLHFSTSSPRIPIFSLSLTLTGIHDWGADKPEHVYMSFCVFVGQKKIPSQGVWSRAREYFYCTKAFSYQFYIRAEYTQKHSEKIFRFNRQTDAVTIYYRIRGETSCESGFKDNSPLKDWKCLIWSRQLHVSDLDSCNLTSPRKLNSFVFWSVNSQRVKKHSISLCLLSLNGSN